MKNFKFVLMFIAVISLAIVSCQKEGPVGPQGETGPQGDQGPQGPTNIISITKTVYTSQWIEYGTFGQPDHCYEAKITIDEITQDVLDEGAIIVFLYENNAFFCLPFTWYYTGYSITFLYAATIGEVYITLSASNFMTPQVIAAIQIKVIIIKNLDLLPPNLDTKNYSEIKEYINN